MFGNFHLSGSVSFHTGMPFSALVQGELSDLSNAQSFSTRADLVPGCNPNAGPKTIAEWFNTSCFVVPGTDYPGTTTVAPGFGPGNLFGDSGRDIIEGPGYFQTNMALQRTIQLNRDQTHTLNLNWQVTNIFNDANYSGFGTTYAATGKGANLGVITAASGMRTMAAVVRFNF